MSRPLRRRDGNRQPNRSRSYILRMWCAGEPGAAEWRASLEDISTGERLGFAGLEQLFAFLMERSERDGGMSARRGSIADD